MADEWGTLRIKRLSRLVNFLVQVAGGSTSSFAGLGTQRNRRRGCGELTRCPARRYYMLVGM